MLYRETIAVCSHIHTNTLCGQNVELFNVSPSSTYSNHRALNGLSEVSELWCTTHPHYGPQIQSRSSHCSHIVNTVQMCLPNWHSIALTATVGIVTRLRNEQCGVRCSARARDFPVLRTLHTGSLANSTFWSAGIRFLLPGWSVESEASHSPPS